MPGFGNGSWWRPSETPLAREAGELVAAQPKSPRPRSGRGAGGEGIRNDDTKFPCSHAQRGNTLHATLCVAGVRNNFSINRLCRRTRSVRPVRSHGDRGNEEGSLVLTLSAQFYPSCLASGAAFRYDSPPLPREISRCIAWVPWIDCAVQCFLSFCLRSWRLVARPLHGPPSRRPRRLRRRLRRRRLVPRPGPIRRRTSRRWTP